jgi:demethylmenaquinone methyltransferase/2-methoxy-6-polyprenyl-1,4-benzoquinol methylase
MRTALSKEKVKSVYDRAYKYYEVLHKLGTFHIDERGRNYLVKRIVKPGTYILDAGGGTGLTAIKAAKKLNGEGRIVILDYSEKMLEIAQIKADKLHLNDMITVKAGDMFQIPFPDNTFDTVLSTYSTCPLSDPMEAVIEMVRVLKKGGVLGIAHSSDPHARLARWLSNQFENIIWKFPGLSLGCRNIQLIDDIRKMDVDVLDERLIGFVPFYFKLIIVRKR